MCGDLIRLDAAAGLLDCLTPDFDTSPPATPDLSANAHGLGRELFETFRRSDGPATPGASVICAAPPPAEVFDAR